MHMICVYIQAHVNVEYFVKMRMRMRTRVAKSNKIVNISLLFS